MSHLVQQNTSHSDCMNFWASLLPCAFTPPPPKWGVYSYHCFLQLASKNIRGKEKWDKNSNIHGASQQHHCCACNLHPNSSVHFQGGKRFCLGHKYVTAQGKKLESVVSWQLCLKKMSVHWKASIWGHKQCSPDSFRGHLPSLKWVEIILGGWRTC